MSRARSHQTVFHILADHVFLVIENNRAERRCQYQKDQKGQSQHGTAVLGQAPPGFLKQRPFFILFFDFACLCHVITPSYCTEL